MSYQDDYGNRGYPGNRAPAPDLTDEAQLLGLDPREGDTALTRRTANHPWGKVVRLHGDGKSITLVQTESFPRPFPWAIQARFSVDGITFTSTIPGTWGGQVIFKFIKSFDVKTGPAPETFVLEAGDPLPLCALIARSLTVSVQIVGESVLDLWVQFVVCPTQQIDCNELVPPTPTPSSPAPYGITTPNLITRFPAVAAVNYSIPAEATRAILTIVNQSAVDLFVTMGAPAQTTPGDELATVVLPAGAVAGYEVAGYVGIVSFKFAADDGAGYALVTRGFY